MVRWICLWHAHGAVWIEKGICETIFFDGDVDYVDDDDDAVAMSVCIHFDYKR